MAEEDWMDAKTFTVVAWNMAHRQSAWGALAGLAPDIALLTEAARPRTLEANVIGGSKTKGADGYRRPWAAAIVSPHPLERVTDARSTRFGRSVEIRFRASRRGSWYAAVTDVPGIGPVTSVALYGLLDEKSDASMHRSLSELTPLFEDRRYNRHLVLGGDFNTWTGWGARSAHLARDRTVLDRIAALGLVDCLDAARKEGRLEGCPCSLGDGCRHVRTRLDPRKPDIPYQMDYLFSSKKLAKRLETCRVADEAPWPKPSDHYPIVATFTS